MKKILLLVSVLISGVLASGQCDPNYDFGDAMFGVSPDPTMGETFETGYLGIAYEDIIHMLVPTEAGDIDTTFAGLGAVIDSLSLVSLTVTIDASEVNLADIGLTVHCNNNGDSPDECTFMGGEQYCALIDGTPTQAGEFPLTINVIAYLTFFGQPQGIPYEFTDYTLLIEEEVSVAAPVAQSLEVKQNIPNPFSNITTINYTVANAGKVQFEVMNLLGERVLSNVYNARRGSNEIKVSAADLNSGIYLYSLQIGDKKVTHRMVVNE
ncbi:MAG: T9SS type A sorting domain-containing protein [Flavobacteriales bacterium]|nr:T9SS type A sorting domain-containing protein [Flavobacteriales bacterium]